MKRITFVLALLALCVLILSGSAMADGNAYGRYKHAADSTTTDPIAVNWTCDTSYDPTTGVATVEFSIDNMAELIAANELVTANWSNLVIDAGEEISIDSMSLGLEGDPAINLNFGVTGGKTSVTTFHIVAPVLSFAPLTNSQGVASAGVTVTDYQLLRNGATANGLFGGKFYEAKYNTSGIYGDLVSGPVTILATDPATATVSESGPVLSLGTVSSMQAEFWFNVTPKDQVSGSSSYAIQGTAVPEPSALVALLSGLIGVGGIVRRRR